VTHTEATQRWGVWITQDRSRGKLPTSYWWQGPEYKGDQLMTQSQAEAMARSLQAASPNWKYEARPYLQDHQQ
jgi:hypothetical protein